MRRGIVHNHCSFSCQSQFLCDSIGVSKTLQANFMNRIGMNTENIAMQAIGAAIALQATVLVIAAAAMAML